jgi:glyoxylase-like metal-dependent hydrolase (beta-lactamase superfamily II)
LRRNILLTYPIEVAQGIYQVQIPLPFALRIVNCYLLRDGDGWTIVDTGINTPEGQAVWWGAFTALNIQPRDLRRILLTHVHPDHYGMAGWLQALAAQQDHLLPVYTSPREMLQASTIWENYGSVRFGDWLISQGMPEEMARAVDAGLEDTRLMTLPHPPEMLPIYDGDTLTIGERDFRLMLADGHSDGQLMLYDAHDHLMLSGDHVLMKITPNIGQWTHTDPFPLQRYRASLTQLQDLEVRLALPGHKALIHDWRGRIAELLAHHDERLQHTRDALAQGNRTPYEVALVIFQHMKFTPHEWRFALAEALAHMDELERRG